MLLIEKPTRSKHVSELKFLANLRMAALVAGDKVSQSPRVQLRAAELLKHLCTALPSPEFQAAYIHKAGALGDGLVLKVNHDMNMVMINRVNAENVVRMASIVVNVRRGDEQ